MTRFCAASLLAISAVTLPVHAQQKGAACAVNFSIAQRDALGNVDIGLSQEDVRWFQKKVMRRYPGVCYAEQETNSGTWLYISISTQAEESATATTNSYPNGDGSTTSHTRVAPRTTTYPVYTLKIGQFKDGKLEVLRTFQRTHAGAGSGVTSLISTFGDPRKDVIQDAVDWLSWTFIPDPPSQPKH